MTQPGNPGYGVPRDGLTQLVRDIEDLKRQIREMQSLLVSGGTIQSPNFDGNAALGLAGTQGYGLDGATGNVAIGTLFLRGGIIGADALAHTVIDQRTSATFATGGADVLAQTVTVPAGRTEAIILLNGVANLQTPTASTNMSAYLKSSAGAIQSDASATTIASSQFGNVGSTLVSAPTGLTPGSTFTLALHVSVSATPPTLSGYAAMTGLVFFL